MGSSGITRAKCYLLLQGLEVSLAENLLRNIDCAGTSLLNADETKKASDRRSEDLGTPDLLTEKVPQEELMRYLDLGDLLNLINRHVTSLKNARREHVAIASQLIFKADALAIRKRVMHPVRPLEAGDLPALLTLAQEVLRKASSLIWAPLKEGLGALGEEARLLDVSIPGFWAEESRIPHNLPPAEFDDTGFIGRQKERKKLRVLLESDHRVITVVAGGGEGKTALALRVCNDIVEDRSSCFERVVWVSLKTKYLTAEGVREVSNAIDSVGAMIGAILEGMVSDTASESQGWNRVIEQMKSTKTLLIIDNLETVGDEIRELVLNIPQGSKVLLTSRVGLGEIEVRFTLDSLAPNDCVHLFRSLAAIYNYASLQRLDDKVVDQCCEGLFFNPLLVRWFVQATGRGIAPELIIRKNGFDEALNFCYANVYEQLGSDAKAAIAVLLASRRTLSKAQLQDIVNLDHVSFAKACQDLICSGMVERNIDSDGTQYFKLGGLVFEYVSRSHPPTPALVANVRERIRGWQVEEERSRKSSQAYRYGTQSLLVRTSDERAAAPHLRRAITAIRSNDFETASAALSKTAQLTPAWCEVHRIRAKLLEQQGRPIYEVEEAYELSIKCDDNDVNRHDYAVYLIKHGEYDRAIEQIDKAMSQSQAVKAPLTSIRGMALVRMGRLEDGIAELDDAWSNRSDALPVRALRSLATQLADAYKRSAERWQSLGNHGQSALDLVKAAAIIDEAQRDHGWDYRLVETAVDIIRAAPSAYGAATAGVTRLSETAGSWDKNGLFRSSALEYWRTATHFVEDPQVRACLPLTYEEIRLHAVHATSETVKTFVGTVKTVFRYAVNPFGFIACSGVGDVYFNRSSLVDDAEWVALNPGVSVRFELGPKGGKSPRACSMRIAKN